MPMIMMIMVIDVGGRPATVERVILAVLLKDCLALQVV